MSLKSDRETGQATGRERKAAYRTVRTPELRLVREKHLPPQLREPRRHPVPRTPPSVLQPREQEKRVAAVGEQEIVRDFLILHVVDAGCGDGDCSVCS